MYDDRVFQPGRAESSPSSFTAPSSTVTEPFLLTKAAEPAVQVSNTTLILVPLSLLALWTIAVLRFNQCAKRHKATLPKDDSHALLKRVPCRQCRFFKNNPYLKCAIRPSEALTAAAIDCTDYASRSIDRLDEI